MKRTRLKFLFFVLFIIVLVIALLILEEYRTHPDYAPMFSSMPMFSGILALPALYSMQRSGMAQALRRTLEQ